MIKAVIGGSGSGKSEYAEKTAVKLKEDSAKEELIYLATMMPEGEEAVKRIERHRKMREEKGFITKECYCTEDIKKIGNKDSLKNSVILLECMSNLVSNEMFYYKSANVSEKIIDTVTLLSEKCGGLVIVTNDVFSDGFDYSFEVLEYMRVMGEINRFIMSVSNEACEVVCGIPIKLF